MDNSTKDDHNLEENHGSKLADNHDEMTADGAKPTASPKPVDTSEVTVSPKGDTASESMLDQLRKELCCRVAMRKSRKMMLRIALMSPMGGQHGRKSGAQNAVLQRHQGILVGLAMRVTKLRRHDLTTAPTPKISLGGLATSEMQSELMGLHNNETLDGLGR